MIGFGDPVFDRTTQRGGKQHLSTLNSRVSSLQLTKDPNRVRSFRGYNIWRLPLLSGTIRGSRQSRNNILNLCWANSLWNHVGAARKLVGIGQKFRKQSRSPIAQLLLSAERLGIGESI